MSWLGLIATLVKLASGIAQWASDRGKITNAQKALIADQLLAEAENVDRAFKARLTQRLLDADGVSDEAADRFRRD